MRKAVVIGVGPDQGLGAQLCRRFASQGLHVFAVGRTQAKVDAVASAIVDSGLGQATAIACDATEETQVTALFDQVGDGLELAIYNAGNNRPGRIIDMEASYFEESWRLVCFGGFLFAREALRRMVPQGAGSILFTGASASLRGRPGYGAFNSSKAAVRVLAQAIAKEYGPEGIHVGHVIVDGGIAGDKIIKGHPDIAKAMGEDALISLDGIVDAFSYLHNQPKSAWTFELDVRTSRENW